MENLILTINNNNITRIYKGNNESCFPILVRLVQNRWTTTSANPYTEESRSDSENNILKKRQNQAGTIGKGYYDFTMDFTCRPIDPGSDEDCFYNINKSLEQLTLPTFSRSYFLDNRYIILQITDYGHQAMSPGFRDFVPMVFVDGQKIWQKYIGIIRQYSQRKAFIVIHPDNNLKDIANLKSAPLEIKIFFKNNIEVAKGSLSSIEGTLSTNDTNDLKTVFTFTISDKNRFLHTNLDDYDIMAGDEVILKTEYISYNYKTANQSIYQQNLENKKEYFRQSYIMDYVDEEDDDGNTIEKKYERDTSIKNDTLEITFSKGFYNFDSNTQLKLVSKQNSYTACYRSNLSSAELKFTSIADLKIFDKSGKRLLTIGENNTNDLFEIIPDFTSKQKVTFTTSSEVSNDNIPDILYNKGFYTYTKYYNKYKFDIDRYDGDNKNEYIYDIYFNLEDLYNNYSTALANKIR